MEMEIEQDNNYNKKKVINIINNEQRRIYPHINIISSDRDNETNSRTITYGENNNVTFVSSIDIINELEKIKTFFNYFDLYGSRDNRTEEQRALCNKNIVKSIRTKLSSYKQQDKQKNRYDTENFITVSSIVDKLIECNCLCYYCSEQVNFDKNNNKQWSVERFNNNVGHFNDNICISCLACNLSRRDNNYKYYKDSKNVVFKKNNSST